MVSSTSTLIALAVGLVLAVLGYRVALRYPPRWDAELNGNWRLFNRLALIFGLCFMLISILGYSGVTGGVLPLTALGVSALVLSYLAVQGSATDLAVRKADGRSQYVGILLAAALNVAMLERAHNSFVVTLTLTSVLVPFAFRWIISPRVVGPADWRAFMLIGAAFLPLAGLSDTIYCLLASSVITFAWALYRVARRSSGLRNFARNLAVSKEPLPVVPSLLIPPAFALPFLALALQMN